MSCFTIAQNGCTDFTVLSNRFIDEYMAEANDAQLKVYLYLLRVVGSGQTTSISDLADHFNFTEKDIMRALKYWEKKKLLALSFDENKALKSLQFLPINSMASDIERVSADTLSVTIPSVQLFSNSTEASTQAPAPMMNNDSDNRYEKPQYSLDQLKAFKADEASSRLLFIAEQYLRKTLTPNEMKSIFFFSDKLGFSEDLIDYLIQYCVGRDKKDFRYIEKVAINWAEAGITTPKQAAKYATKYEKVVYDIMNALGKNTTPTDGEIAFINRWTKEYGFEFGIIQVACNRTVLATDSHRFEYCDKILSSWFNAGVHHKSDIDKLDQSHKKTGTSGNKPNTQGFTRFEQHDYDFSALERQLLDSNK